MTAPTKDEIKAGWTAVEFRAFDCDSIIETIDRLTESLWESDDFRPSEQETLDGYVSQALKEFRSNAAVQLRKLVLGAVEAFAADVPDAPRASTKPETRVG